MKPKKDKGFQTGLEQQATRRYVEQKYYKKWPTKKCHIKKIN